MEEHTVSLYNNTRSSIYYLEIVNGPDPFPIGTAFAITSHRVLTCCHNLFDYEKGEVPYEIKVKLTNENGSLSAYYLKGDQDLDYAILFVENGGLKPLTIFDRPPQVMSSCLLFGYNVGLVNVESSTDLLEPVAHDTKINMVGQTEVHYTVSAFKGDSGSALLLSTTGQVVAMHTTQINTVRKNKKHINDLREDLSSSVSGVSVGLRLDILRDVLLN
jgi:hypothetical protein